MKDLIVTIGLVLLGIFLFTSLVMGDGEDSLKTGAEGMTSSTISKLQDTFK